MLANAINQLLSSLSQDKLIWANAPAEILETHIDALEKQLRTLIAERLTGRGERAWDTLVAADIQKTVKGLIKKQEDNNPYAKGQHETVEAKLSFCLFSSLFRIIKDNWGLFADVFGTGPQFDTYHKFVLDARNKFKHHNTISDSELAAASAGILWLEQCLSAIDVESEDELEEVAV